MKSWPEAQHDDTPSGRDPDAQLPANEPTLRFRNLSPKDFAAELEGRVDEVEQAVRRIEAAKAIPQHILDLEISI